MVEPVLPFLSHNGRTSIFSFFKNLNYNTNQSTNHLYSKQPYLAA